MQIQFSRSPRPRCLLLGSVGGRSRECMEYTTGLTEGRSEPWNRGDVLRRAPMGQVRAGQCQKEGLLRRVREGARTNLRLARQFLEITTVIARFRDSQPRTLQS